jgi:sugar lactone lactonase YvrE
MRAHQLTDPVCEHGEGAVYDDRWSGVRWVDMLAGDILELTDAGVSRRHVGRIAAMLRPRSAGGFVVALERQLALADFDDLETPMKTAPDLWAESTVRMNEGGCAPDGTLYLGSMAYDEGPGGGRLYRIRAGLSAEIAIAEVTISNGIGWSPDADRAYYVDTATHRIDVFSWSAERGLADRRPFAAIDGNPDGLCVDGEGGVWVALWGGGAVLRYDADGGLSERIELPVSRVTSVAFAGVHRDQLVITTSRLGLPDNAAEPEAGALFGASPGIRGLPLHAFAG